METEIRQPFAMPITINVPDSWLGLASRRERIVELKTKARGDEAAQVLLELAQSELQQLIDQCGWQLYRRDALRQELAKATSGPEIIRAYLPNEKPVRSRIELLTDLAACADFLVAISGDEALRAEAAELREQLTEAYQEA